MNNKHGQEAPSSAVDPRIDDAVKLATQEFTAALSDLGDKYPVAAEALRAAQQEAANQTRKRVASEIGREKAQEFFGRENTPLPQKTTEMGWYEFPIYKINIDGGILSVYAYESGDDEEPCLHVSDATGHWNHIYISGLYHDAHDLDKVLSDPLSYPSQYLAIIEAIKKNDRWIEPMKTPTKS